MEKLLSSRKFKISLLAVYISNIIRIMKRLIVNADDFGVTEGVNQAIVECYQKGIVTSTTLMVNMWAYEDAVKLAIANPSLGVGIHLNITDGSPVTQVEKVATLVSKDGTFLPRGEFIKRLAFSKINRKEIEIELRAQVKKFLNSNLIPTHLDGHQHIHVLPMVFPVVLNLAMEFRIPIRVPDEKIIQLRIQGKKLRNLFDSNFYTKRTFKLFTKKAKYILRRNGIATVDALLSLYGMNPFPCEITHETFVLLLENIVDETTELMVHPGYATEQLANFWVGGWTAAYQREAELKALIHPYLKEKIDLLNIKLINYFDFGKLK